MVKENINKSEVGSEATSSTILWNSNTLHLPCVVKRYSKLINKVVCVNFESLKIARGGLLEKSLIQIQLPAHYKRTKKFLNDILHLSADEKIRLILGTPTNHLEVHQIYYLFSEHDKYLSSLSIKYKGIRASHFRVYFNIFDSLKNGNRVGELGYKSIHKESHKADIKTTLLSEQIDPGEKDGEMKGPISSLTFTSLNDLEEKAKKHLQNRISRLEEACWDIVQTHKNIVRRHNALKQKPLCAELSVALGFSTAPIFLRKHYEENKDKESILHFLIHYIEVHKLYQPKPWKFSIGGSYVLDADFYEISSSKNLRSRSTLLASYFIPNLVLVACQYLLQIYSKGWNPDSVRSLSFRDLEYLDEIKAYKLNGFKSKTDQNLTPLYFDNPNSRPFQILQILEGHNRNLNQYCKREGDFLLAGYCQVHRHYGLFNPKREHKGIVDKYQLQSFAPSAIRDQIINAEYLNSGKDIRLVKELLGHVDLGTVDIYLNHHIQRNLNEANINQFMTQLSESIIWAVDMNASKGKDSNDLGESKLLFPLGEQHIDSNYLCDSWIQSAESIEIGIDEIKHSVYQFNYYKENFQRLKTANPTRFSKLHLPRIVFAIALNQIISESKFGFLVRKLNEGPLFNVGGYS